MLYSDMATTMESSKMDQYGRSICIRFNAGPYLIIPPSNWLKGSQFLHKVLERKSYQPPRAS